MNESYDYIVVGAGTAGCIMAARLSEDAGVKVLLVEAGGSDRSMFITMPAALPFVYQNSKINWGHYSGPEPYADDKMIEEKAGRVIGGTSSINAMIYNRGNPLDYEGWTATGLTEWDYAHVLPYFRKLEAFVDGPNEWRGGDGPVHVTRCRAAHPLFETFVRGGEQAGFPVTSDHNGYQQEGMHIAQAFVDKGVRWSASRAYLRPAAHRPNLTVLTNAPVSCPVTARLCCVPASWGRRSCCCCLGWGRPRNSTGTASRFVPTEVGKNLQNHPGVDVQFGTAFEDSLTAELSVPQAGVDRCGMDVSSRAWEPATSSRPVPSSAPATTSTSPTCNTSSCRCPAS